MARYFAAIRNRYDETIWADHIDAANAQAARDRAALLFERTADDALELLGRELWPSDGYAKIVVRRSRSQP